MPGQFLYSTRVDELHAALSGALPPHAVIRMNSDDAPSVDVHAWWKVGTYGSGRKVNSLSFHLTASMMQTYLNLPETDRAAVCRRLAKWATWALDGAPRKFDGWLGFDINADVPMGVFFPEASATEHAAD